MNSLTFLCTLLILFGVNTLMNVIQFHCVLTNCLLGKKNSHVQYQVSQSGLGDSYRTTWRSRKNDYWSLLLSCHWNFVILSKRDCHSFNVEYSLDILCFSLTSLLKSILNTGWWSSILPSSAVSCRHLIFPTRTGKIFHFKVSSSSLNVYFPKLGDPKHGVQLPREPTWSTGRISNLRRETHCTQWMITYTQQCERAREKMGFKVQLYKKGKLPAWYGSKTSLTQDLQKQPSLVSGYEQPFLSIPRGYPALLSLACF